MNIASSLIEKLNLTEYVFKIVRDETFKVALELAFEQSPQTHPMISTDRQTGRNYVDFDKLDYWTREPKSLRNHEKHRTLLHPRTSVCHEKLGRPGAIGFPSRA